MPFGRGPIQPDPYGDVQTNHHQKDVSENSGTPKSSILIGFSIINHPFWGTPIFGNTQKVIHHVSIQTMGSHHPHPAPQVRWNPFCS